ncbi:hypothetical protein [Cryptosporangium minutisporangium]|uniref:hypothetical protein n=1 Tax=Cryptosporangium minutisporangium TaxID=113569 RepID=UPI0035E6393C
MTEYIEIVDGQVTDIANTHGIIEKERLGGTEPEWQTAVNPQLLRELADLIEFCYGSDDCIEVGVIPPWKSGETLPALAVGHMEDDRWLMLTPRTDTDLLGDGGNASLDDFGGDPAE